MELYRRGEKNAGAAALRLHNGLKKAGVMYFDDTLNYTPATYDTFKTTCDEILQKERPELEQHRGWKKFLGNLGLFIAGLGIIFLVATIINKAITGKFLFFSTNSATKIDAIEDVIKKAASPAA